jgi:hypothetical protein
VDPLLKDRKDLMLEKKEEPAPEDKKDAAAPATSDEKK